MFLFVHDAGDLRLWWLCGLYGNTSHWLPANKSASLFPRKSVFTKRTGSSHLGHGRIWPASDYPFISVLPPYLTIDLKELQKRCGMVLFVLFCFFPCSMLCCMRGWHHWPTMVEALGSMHAVKAVAPAMHSAEPVPLSVACSFSLLGGTPWHRSLAVHPPYGPDCWDCFYPELFQSLPHQLPDTSLW